MTEPAPTYAELSAALADLVRRHDFRDIDNGRDAATSYGAAWITARNLVRRLPAEGAA